MTILCNYDKSLTLAIVVLIILLIACIRERDCLYNKEQKTSYSLVTTCILIASCVAIGNFHIWHSRYTIDPERQMTIKTNFSGRPTVTFENIEPPISMSQTELETLQSMLGNGIPVEIETAIKLFGDTEELESLATQKESEEQKYNV